MTAEFKNGAYEPGVYVKGDVARRANTPSEAAKYVWDGFVRQADEAPAKSETEGGEKANEPGDPGPTTQALAEPEAPSDKLPEGDKPSAPRTRKPSGGSK